MKDLIPLLQTVAWVALALYLVRYFRPEVVLLRKVLNQRLEGGGMVRIGLLELGALQKEVQDVTRELGDLNARVSELFLTTMSSAMYYNLQKLASNSFGRFQMTQGLRRELYHLRDIGYIEIDSISNLPSEGSNLSAFVRVTETGRRFIALRGDLEGAQGVVARHDAMARADQPATNT